MKKKTIYLDHGASTPVHPQVIEAMLPYWTEHYGNPSSSHTYGRLAEQGLEQARQTFADLLHVQPKEIIFTGCGSESDNLALRGVMAHARANKRGNHLVTCVAEHEAVWKTAVHLRDYHNYDLTIIGVNQYGQIELDELKNALRDDTVLVSIMAANNEIGSLNPIEQIGALCHQRGILFHTDAIQAAAIQPWHLTQQPIDLMSIAPHKFYGPKGIGVLVVKEAVSLVSNLTGGEQENGHRAGTVNVPFAVGAAKAFSLAMQEREQRNKKYQQVRDQLIDGLLNQLPDDCILTGHPTERLPHHASFALRHVDANQLLMHLDMVGIAASSGSACKTGNPEPSKTLQAMGLTDEWTKSGLRLTVGLQTSPEDIAYVLAKLPPIVARLQKMQTLFA